MRNRTALAIFLSLTVFAGSHAFAGDFVVLSSTAPSIQVGSVVSDGAEITVPPRRRVVLVSEAGRTISLRGPFQGVPGGGESAGGGQQFVKALASLVRTTQADAKSVGAIRAAGIRTDREAMMINVSETGDYCIFGSGGRELTRYKSEKWKSLTLVAAADGAAETIPWPAGTRVIPWPKKIPLKHGATYLVQQAGKDSRTMVVAHFLEGKFATDAHRVLALAKMGCMEQAKMMLALMRKTAK